MYRLGLVACEGRIEEPGSGSRLGGAAGFPEQCALARRPDPGGSTDPRTERYRWYRGTHRGARLRKGRVGQRSVRYGEGVAVELAGFGALGMVPEAWRADTTETVTGSLGEVFPSPVRSTSSSGGACGLARAVTPRTLAGGVGCGHLLRNLTGALRAGEPCGRRGISEPTSTPMWWWRCAVRPGTWRKTALRVSLPWRQRCWSVDRRSPCRAPPHGSAKRCFARLRRAVPTGGRRSLAGGVMRLADGTVSQSLSSLWWNSRERRERPVLPVGGRFSRDATPLERRVSFTTGW